MKQYTSYADRQEIVVLHKQGDSYRVIAQKTGWSFEVVRKICRDYKRRQEEALQPQLPGRPMLGPLSSFDALVRFAYLRIKRQHPGWGPDVVLAELRNRPWAQRVKLPRPTQIGVYFSQFGDRLVNVRSHKQLPQAKPLAPALHYAHRCWQIDADERLLSPGYGLAHIWNIVDYATGIKIGAFLFPAQPDGQLCRVSWPQMGNYPFPMPFTLWLVGLGIEHELIRRVTENGCFVPTRAW